MMMVSDIRPRDFPSRGWCGYIYILIPYICQTHVRVRVRVCGAPLQNTHHLDGGRLVVLSLFFFPSSCRCICLKKRRAFEELQHHHQSVVCSRREILKINNVSLPSVFIRGFFKSIQIQSWSLHTYSLLVVCVVHRGQELETNVKLLFCLLTALLFSVTSHVVVVVPR